MSPAADVADAPEAAADAADAPEAAADAPEAAAAAPEAAADAAEAGVVAEVDDGTKAAVVAEGDAPFLRLRTTYTETKYIAKQLTKTFYNCIAPQHLSGQRLSCEG